MGQAASSNQRPDSSLAQYSVPSRNSDRDTMNLDNLLESTLDNQPSHQQNEASYQGSLSGPPMPFQPFASQPMDDDVSMHSLDTDQMTEAGSLVGSRHEDSRYTPLMMTRRQSTMSRLGSRILPNNVIRTLLNSDEETPAEGHAHRNGRWSRSFSRSEAARSSRFSPFNSFGSRGITRRRTIRGPYPLLHGDPGLLSDAGSNHSEPRLDDMATPGRSWARGARLARMRTSLPTPVSDIFGSPPALPTLPTVSSSDLPMAAPQPLRPVTPVGMDRLLPPPIPTPPIQTQTRVDREQGHESDSVDPSPWINRPPSPSASARGPSDPPPGGHLPRLVRTQSTRTLRREEQTPLSRVLQLAASAIAAQLSGNANPSPLNIQPVGNPGLTASLDSLVQSLQQITSTQGRDMPPSGDGSGQPPGGNPTPFNFLRVFRFANSAGSSRPQGGAENDNNDSDRMDVDEPNSNNNEPAEGRTVTLVVVGVRSVPSRDLHRHHPDNLVPNPLFRNPFATPNQRAGSEDSAGDSVGHADAGSRLSSRDTPEQQAPVSLDGQSQHTPAPSDSRAPSAISNGGANAAMSDSPPGPNPPPSTPAEPTFSAPPSGTATPSGRPSTASLAAANITPQPNQEPTHFPDTTEPADPNVSAAPGAQQRRRSNSEQARHRDLGSGAARRNGFVESDRPPSSAGRTWVIYVVGTNLSENHPAVATPSLFTDVSFSAYAIESITC